MWWKLSDLCRVHLVRQVWRGLLEQKVIRYGEIIIKFYFLDTVTFIKAFLAFNIFFLIIQCSGRGTEVRLESLVFKDQKETLALQVLRVQWVHQAQQAVRCRDQFLNVGTTVCNLTLKSNTVSLTVPARVILVFSPVEGWCWSSWCCWWSWP